MCDGKCTNIVSDISLMFTRPHSFYIASLALTVVLVSACGLYYKHMMIINDDSSVVNEQSS